MSPRTTAPAAPRPTGGTVPRPEQQHTAENDVPLIPVSVVLDALTVALNPAEGRSPDYLDGMNEAFEKVRAVVLAHAAPRVFAAVVPPDCLCQWSRDGEDWRLTGREQNCPLHGPGQPFDHWTRVIPPEVGEQQ